MAYEQVQNSQKLHDVLYKEHNVVSDGVEPVCKQYLTTTGAKLVTRQFN
jgi:hypothetical protein